MVTQLDQNIVDKIYAEMREGYARVKKGEYAEAEPHFLRAWHMIPDPRYDWDISQITVYRITKFYRDAKRFADAERWAQDAFKCNPLPGDGEPYVILGSVYFESGALNLARENFQKAFELSGERVFEGEDIRYFKFLKESKMR